MAVQIYPAKIAAEMLGITPKALAARARRGAMLGPEDWRALDRGFRPGRPARAPEGASNQVTNGP